MTADRINTARSGDLVNVATRLPLVMLPTTKKKFAHLQRRFSDADGRKEEDGSTPDPGSKSGPMMGPRPLEPKRAIFKFALRTMEKGCKPLRDEFMAMPRKVLEPDKTKVFYQNNTKNKNRYKDVGCLDAHRVKLKDYGDNDYIHANYVKTPMSEKRFICTQAPLEATIADFWAMILQEGVQNIIMLVSMSEKERKKWSEYFPTEANEEIKFDEYAVQCLGQKWLDFKSSTPTEIRETSLRVDHDGKSQRLKHYHWVYWPDREVPPADLAVVELLQKISTTKTPIVVHCSAGVGRTGVVVMIQYVLEMVQLGLPVDSLAPILKEIRSQRGNSIQTPDQYCFCHMVLLQYWFHTELLDKAGALHFAKFTEDYKKNMIMAPPKDDPNKK